MQVTVLKVKPRYEAEPDELPTAAKSLKAGQMVFVQQQADEGEFFVWPNTPPWAGPAQLGVAYRDTPEGERAPIRPYGSEAIERGTVIVQRQIDCPLSREKDLGQHGCSLCANYYRCWFGA